MDLPFQVTLRYREGAGTSLNICISPIEFYTSIIPKSFLNRFFAVKDYSNLLLLQLLRAGLMKNGFSITKPVMN